MLILWAVGLMSHYTLGGFIHVLLLIAIVMVITDFIRGRRSILRANKL